LWCKNGALLCNLLILLMIRGFDSRRLHHACLSGYAWQAAQRQRIAFKATPYVQRHEKRARRSSPERSGANRVMYFVYFLRSTSNPEQTYIGFTSDLQKRITAHNNGQSPHTSKYKSWELITYIAFNDRTKALSFEKYLKSHSGRAFAAKHF
jgi:putative endonuclease